MKGEGSVLALVRKLALLAPVTVLLSTCGELTTGAAPDRITELPRQLSLSEREIIRASNRFAFDLAHQVSVPDSTFFLSPLSASMALGMTMNGAEGDTFDQMRSALGFEDLPLAEINASYRSLIELLLDLDPTVEMALGNSIWHRNEFQVREAFRDTVQAYFGADVTALDFADPGAGPRINEWVAGATNGRIEEIVPVPIPDHIVMYLLNAIYFRGDWTVQFDPDRTAEGDFHLPDGGTVRVPLMSRDADDVEYLRGSGFQAVDIPYGGEAFAMTVVLPDPGSDVEAVLSEMDAGSWRDLTGAFSQQEIQLSLPRFEIEYERVLNDALKALGMTDAFDGDLADLGALTPDPGAYIDEVRQKTFVAVDEVGTEAAAVTSVGVVVVSAPPTFRVDRPFLFAIRERLSGTILFLGKVTDPTAGELDGG